ncbi:hypothetical protein EDC01DRAFT_789229 [Geopyxis carbonaria]|nr:hypothetical protein EDC01DRAFT_789229 [Geopyxis carbonaria]
MSMNFMFQGQPKTADVDRFDRRGMARQDIPTTDSDSGTNTMENQNDSANVDKLLVDAGKTSVSPGLPGIPGLGCLPSMPGSGKEAGPLAEPGAKAHKGKTTRGTRAGRRKGMKDSASPQKGKGGRNGNDSRNGLGKRSTVNHGKNSGLTANLIRQKILGQDPSHQQLQPILQPPLTWNPNADNLKSLPPGTFGWLPPPGMGSQVNQQKGMWMPPAVQQQQQLEQQQQQRVQQLLQQGNQGNQGNQGQQGQQWVRNVVPGPSRLAPPPKPPLYPAQRPANMIAHQHQYQPPQKWDHEQLDREYSPPSQLPPYPGPQPQLHPQVSLNRLQHQQYQQPQGSRGNFNQPQYGGSFQQQQPGNIQQPGSLQQQPQFNPAPQQSLGRPLPFPQSQVRLNVQAQQQQHAQQQPRPFMTPLQPRTQQTASYPGPPFPKPPQQPKTQQDVDNLWKDLIRTVDTIKADQLQRKQEAMAFLGACQMVRN